MSKVNCSQADWQQDVSAIAGLNSGGSASDSIANLIDGCFKIIQEAKDTISSYDTDGVINPSFDTNSVGKYPLSSFPSLTEILHNYSKNAPSAIRNDIDLPFNTKLDSFLGAMSNADIKNYSTAATGSLARSNDLSTGQAGVVTLKDLLEPSTPLGEQLKREYIEFKNKIGDDFTYEEYKELATNLASYDYDSFLEALLKKSVAFALTVAVTNIPVIGPIISFTMSGVGALDGLWGAATGNSLLTGKKLSSEEQILSGIFGAMNLAFAGLTAYNGLKGKIGIPSEKASGANLNKLKPNEINNMSLDELRNSIPKDWQFFENNGRVHIKDANGNFRVRIDPPDKVTNYEHMHIFDENKNPLDINGNIVDKKSPDGHIPWTNK